MSVPTVKSPLAPTSQEEESSLPLLGGGEHQVGLGWPFPLSRSKEMQLELPIVNKGTKCITMN